MLAHIAMMRILMRMAHGQVARALQRWCLVLVTSKRERAEEERRQRCMLTVISRMANAAMWAAYERWREGVVEERERALKLGRALLRWRAAAVWRCYEAWRRHAEEKIRKDVVVRRALVRLMSRCVGAALASWVAQAAHAKYLERKLAAALERWSCVSAARAFSVGTPF